MISITRPGTVPPHLVRRGVAQTTNDCTAYDGCPDDYRSGKVRFSAFDRNIYAAPSVKAVLVRFHHGKCCYCEKKFIPANLHVEHFRPKSGVKQGRNQKELHIGYYWLAYVWENLLLACHDCNSVYKSTIFPLANPNIRTKRTLSHHYDITLENPLLVDPVSVNPRNHIIFRGVSPVALSRAGRTTIREIGLRRPSLREDRMKRLGELRMLRDIDELARNDPANLALRNVARRARRVLRSATRPEAEYSSMAHDFLHDW